MKIVKTTTTFEDGSSQDLAVPGSYQVITRVTQTLHDGTVQTLPAPAGNTMTITSVNFTFSSGYVLSLTVTGEHTKITGITQTDDSGVITTVPPSTLPKTVASVVVNFTDGTSETITPGPVAEPTDDEVDVLVSDGTVKKFVPKV